MNQHDRSSRSQSNRRRGLETRGEKGNTRKNGKIITRRPSEIRGQALHGVANPNSTNVPDNWHKMQEMAKVIVEMGPGAKKNAEEQYKTKQQCRHEGKRRRTWSNESIIVPGLGIKFLEMAEDSF